MISKNNKIFALGGVICLLLVFIGDCLAEDVARGMILYQSNCLRCHGEKGDGQGPESANLGSQPTDFTSSQMSSFPDSLLEKAVVEGVSTVSSHAWGTTFSKDDVALVIKYVRTFQE